MADTVYEVKAKALWPVHIGGGPEQVLDVFGYQVRDGWLYRLAIDAMMAKDERFASDFVAASESPQGVMELRSVVARAFDPAVRAAWVWRTRVSATFAKIYEEKIHNPDNQLLVQGLPRTPAGAYVPGSSIKGALRTAVLDTRARSYHNGYKGLRKAIDARISEMGNRASEKKRLELMAQWAETLALNPQWSRTSQIVPEIDPFRHIVVSDAALNEDDGEIVQVRNVGKTGKPLGIGIFVETIRPGVEFTFTVTIRDRVTSLTGGGDANAVTWNELVGAAHDYYQQAVFDEAENFYAVNPKAQRAVDLVEELDKKPDADSWTVLRLGRFTHLESKSFNSPQLRLPNPPRDGRSGRVKPTGTTRNLVDGVMPLGMVALHFKQRQ